MARSWTLVWGVAAASAAWTFLCAGTAPTWGVIEPDPEPWLVPAPELVVEPQPPVEPPEPGATFPLHTGDRWRWEVVARTGAGPRVFLMATEPARSEVLATWDLSVGDVGADGRFDATLAVSPSEGAPSRTALTLWVDDGALWMDGPAGPTLALELTAPPRPVAPEDVPCVAHVLGGYEGTCSPAPGGPLGVAPGPRDLAVSGGGHACKTLAQVLVGVGTLGIFIPGNKTTTVTASLDAYETDAPPPRSAVVDAWRGRPRLSELEGRLARAAITLDEGAAIVATAPERDAVAAARLVMRSLPPEDRAPVARVALQRVPWHEERLPAIAAMVPELEGQRPLLAGSVADRVASTDRATAVALLEGRYRALRATLLATPPGRASALAGALATTPLDPGEARAILEATDGAPEIFGALHDATPADQRHGLALDAMRQLPFDDERLALLDARTALFAEAASDQGRASGLIDAMSFGEGRVAVAGRLLAAAAPDARPELLRLACRRMDFDDERLALLRAHPELVTASGPAQRGALLGTFSWAAGREEAEALLAP